jgi:hypothetical protein
MADGKAGAPEGNSNAVKRSRLVADTLRKVAVQNPKRLRAACEALLEKAENGDAQAFKEIRDTLDGKPIQAIEGTGDNGEMSMAVTVKYVGTDG